MQRMAHGRGMKGVMFRLREICIGYENPQWSVSLWLPERPLHPTAPAARNLS
jgi:hypothetical protein